MCPLHFCPLYNSFCSNKKMQCKWIILCKQIKRQILVIMEQEQLYQDKPISLCHGQFKKWLENSYLRWPYQYNDLIIDITSVLLVHKSAFLFILKMHSKVKPYIFSSNAIVIQHINLYFLLHSKESKPFHYRVILIFQYFW